MLALGWGLAAAMGAVSGMLTAPALASFDQNLMQPVLLYAFAGAVLGGLDSPLGAVVGSLLLGVLINLIGTLRRLGRHRPAAAGRPRGDPRRAARASRPASSAAPR